MTLDFLPKGRSIPPLVACAALCGFFAWGYGLTPLAALVVPLWFLSTTRTHAWLTMFAYFMGASRTIPYSSAVFFRDDSSVAFGVALWVASSALLALPWAIFRPAQNTWHRVGHLASALALSTIPLIGLIGWTSPWLGASLIAPGFGWGSLLLGFALLASCSDVNKGRSGLKLASAFAVCAIAAFAGSNRQMPAPPTDWLGVTMHAGRAPESAQEQGARQAAILQAVDAALAQGKKVIVLPEQILGTWSETWRLFLEATLGQSLRDAGTTLVLGAAVPTGEMERTFNSLLAFDGYGWQQVNARFAIPVSMWKPWRNDSTEVEWFTSGTYSLVGRKVMVSLCYEDLLIWPTLLSFTTRPDLIVSLANAWWAGAAPAILDIQREHVEAWARIFNVPLVRALNAP